MLFQGGDQAQDRRHSRIPNWRATVNESEHNSFAVARSATIAAPQKPDPVA